MVCTEFAECCVRFLNKKRVGGIKENQNVE